MDLKLFKDQVTGKNLPAKEKDKFVAIIEQKKTMLTVPEVQAKLTSVEMSVAESSTKDSIRFIPDQELVDKVKTMAKMIARDAGITKWNEESMQYGYTRFFTVLKSYYSELSIEEVKKAFELGMIGMLDEYLPKDSEGNPDKKHYQQFSVEYYTKILNAYRKKKGDIWGKVRQALPAPELVISDKVRDYNKQAIINEIYDAYIAYQNGVSPRFPISVHVNVLIEQGHIKELPAPTPEEYTKAYRMMLLSPHLTRDQKKKIKEEHKLPGMPSYLKTEAQSMANNRAIALVFDGWIKQGFDLIKKKKNGRNIS